MTTLATAAISLAFATVLTAHAQDFAYPAPQDNSAPAPIVRIAHPRAQPYDSSQQQIQPAQATPDDPNTPDPALANFAPVTNNELAPQDPNSLPADPVAYTPNPQLQSDDSYQQPGAAASPDDTTPDTEADQPPPDLFDYDQPFAPGPFYIWTPGYWAHNRLGFFWVPGQWFRAPFYGALWTPPYWGFSNGNYRFHSGYWGTHIGYYGGVNYGFGYTGIGFFGGYWTGTEFFYNTAVARVPSTITTIYNHTTVFYGVNPSVRTSYNGGSGGLQIKPLTVEIAAAREPHLSETASQAATRRIHSRIRDDAFSQNQGHPARAAMVTRIPIIRPGTTLPAILPAANLQAAQQLEAHRAEMLQRMREQAEARRAAGQLVTTVFPRSPASSTTTTRPRVSQAGSDNIPPGTTVTHAPISSRPASMSTQTVPRYEPNRSMEATSTARRDPPTTEPTQPHREEPRPEPIRTEPAHTEPARVESTGPRPAETPHEDHNEHPSGSAPQHPEPHAPAAPHPVQRTPPRAAIH